LGTGAHDDGAGCMQALEALHLLKEVRYVPTNTIRVVLFTNEENGLRGAKKFYETAMSDSYDEYIAAIESDSGGLSPLGFGLDGTKEQLKKMRTWAKYFAPYYISHFGLGHGGADISPFKKEGVPLINFKPDPQRYFQFHHSELDVFSNVNEREINLGAAAIASMIFLIDHYGL
jgi:carboxypeptidase Q